MTLDFTPANNATHAGNAAFSTATGENNPGAQIFLVVVQTGSVTTDGVVSDSEDPLSQGWTAITHASNAGGRMTLWSCNHGAGDGSQTITFTPDVNCTHAGFRVYLLIWAIGSGPGGQRGANAVVQSIEANGSSGVAPSAGTFGAAPKTTNAVMTAVCELTSTSPTFTPPTGYNNPAFGFVDSVAIAMAASWKNSGETNATIASWGFTAGFTWLCINAELYNAEQDGIVAPAESLHFQQLDREVWVYTTPAGSRRKVGENMLIQALQGAAIEVDIYLVDSCTGGAFLGAASQVVSQIKNPGAAFSTFSPTSVTSRGNGHFAVVIPAGTVSTLGINRLRFTTTPTAAEPMAQACDGYALDVIAYNRQDGVRLGLTSLPNAAAAAVGGMATISAVGQAPGGVLKPNSMEDNLVYSSGKLSSSRLRVFANAAGLAAAVPGHANNADGEVERYVSAATYNVDGTLATFSWTKQL